MINIEQERGFLNVSYYDTDGEIVIKNIKLSNEQQFEWVDNTRSRDEHPIFKSWATKGPVSKKKGFFLSKARQIEVLEQLPKDVQDEIYQFNIPKKSFVDIETRVDGEWPNPAVARHEVTAISYVIENELVVMGTKMLEPAKVKAIGMKINEYVGKHGYEPYSFKFFYYKTEASMLLDFFANQIKKMPLLTGWNFIGFDWTYLVNRAKRLDIDPSLASPVGKLVGRDNLPLHRVVVDYLEIYKKWDYGIFKENNTLDYVAKTATGMGKIKFTGSFDELYDGNYAKYVYYNAIDSILVQLIDKKLETMSIYLHLGDITKTPLDKVMSPIALTENVLIREFLSRGLVVPLDKTIKKRGSYEGAYVFVPMPGLYEWVASFDFASLYPSIMRQWNMSPETFIKELHNNPGKVCKAITGVFFDNEKDSGFRTILANYYSQRKVAKKVMQESFHDAFLLKEFLKKVS